MAQNLAEKFLAAIKSDIGDPYVYGAAGPKEFDCSGLIYYNLRKLGINAPRTSEEQWSWVQRIKRNQLQPGDLIFYQFPGDNAPPGHVVIYAGNGNIIQAPQPGQDVQEDSIGIMSGGQVIGYGRVPGLTGTASATLDSSGGSGVGGGLGIGFETIPGLGQLGGAVGTVTGVASTVGDVGTALQAIAKDVGTAVHFLAVLGHPSTWLRIGAFFGGLVTLAIAIYFLSKAIGMEGPKMPTVIPIPV